MSDAWAIAAYGIRESVRRRVFIVVAVLTLASAVLYILGAKIAYAPTSIAEFKQKMEQIYKFPPFLVQHLVEVAQDYQDGIFAGTNDVVQMVTGKAPLSVAAFIDKNRTAFT